MPPSDLPSQKSVFISYRRERWELAWLILSDLRANGYDVFLDADSTGSGDYSKIILSNVAARAHFIVLLTDGCLDRCHEEQDLFRLEIEAAIASRRNIVLLTDGRFDFGSPAVKSRLVGGLNLLPKYNALPLPFPPSPIYLSAALEALRNQYLAKRPDEVVHPDLHASTEDPKSISPPAPKASVPFPLPVPGLQAGTGQRNNQSDRIASPHLDFSGTAIILLAHYPVASALAQAANVVSPERSRQVFAIDVSPTSTIEELNTELSSLVAGLKGHPVLLLTDVFGATPSNVARAMLKVETESLAVVSGLNVPMLWRAMVYLDLPLTELTLRAIAGGQQGIMQIRS